jgi:hypothetical protein
MDLFLARKSLLNLSFCSSQHKWFEYFVQLPYHMHILLLCFLLTLNFGNRQPVIERLSRAEYFRNEEIHQTP